MDAGQPRQIQYLYGDHELVIDEKNRLFLPAEVRKALGEQGEGEGFIMLIGRNGIPWLYPEPTFEEMAGRQRRELTSRDDLIAFDRALFGRATRLVPDRQKRVLLPEKTLRRCGIGREVTLVGVRDHLELWNRGDWTTEDDRLDGEFPELVNRLSRDAGNGASAPGTE